MSEFDLPEANTDTSSVGPQWPPGESSFNRVKGFYNKHIIENAEEFGLLLGEVGGMASSLEKRIDRVSIRLIVQNTILNQCLPDLREWGEAVLPLSGTQDILEDTSILYIARNRDSRRSDPRDLSASLVNYKKAVARKQIPYSQMLSRVVDQGYTLEIPSFESRIKDEDFLNQLADLYKRFAWNKDEVADLVRQENNLIMVAKDGNQIVSAGIAELNMLSFTEQDLSLRIVEITEAATLEEYGGKGLYSAVSAALLRQLNELSMTDQIFSGKIDIAFGECNGSSPGVLNAAHSQGRTFCAEVADRTRLPLPGILQQHVPIQGADRNTLYNDLFPSYISRSRLMEIART